MNGAHDMGGMQGFGPIDRDEAAFHADWEKRVRAVQTLVRARGVYNIDESRWGIERMRPAEYLQASYFERWLASLETNLVDKGVLAPGELDQRMATVLDNPDAPLPAPAASDSPAVPARGEPGHMPMASGPAPRFAPGDRVVTRNVHPHGHTRLPRYARGKPGVIRLYHGNHPLADAAASGQGLVPEPLYSVEFDAAELWGESADGPGFVHLDLWESYLLSEEEGKSA